MSSDPLIILKHKRFIKEKSIGLDFTSESPISVVEFLPFAPKQKDHIEHLVNQFQKKFEVNYVVISTGKPKKETPFSTFTLNGLIDFDVWNDPFYIGKLLYELLITVNKSKYIIFTGDCGGGYSAILATKSVPINSLLCTTPFISFKDMESYGYKSEQVTSHEHRVWLKNWIDTNIYDKVNDLFPLLIQLKNLGTRIEFHWAENPTKTDLYERDRVLSLEPSINLKVYSHKSPPYFGPHLIGGWLRYTSILDRLYKTEIDIGKLFLKSTNNE
jgi:hypothetical protein